jgi:hypothetical protein
LDFNQTIDVQTTMPKNLEWFCKKSTLKIPHAWAGIWARVDTKDDERGFDNMDRPIKINEWQSYTVEGTLTNSKSLSFEVYVFTMVNSI